MLVTLGFKESLFRLFSFQMSASEKKFRKHQTNRVKIQQIICFASEYKQIFYGQRRILLLLYFHCKITMRSCFSEYSLALAPFQGSLDHNLLRQYLRPHSFIIFIICNMFIRAVGSYA